MQPRTRQATLGAYCHFRFRYMEVMDGKTVPSEGVSFFNNTQEAAEVMKGWDGVCELEE